MDPRDLVKRPLITERTTMLMEENKYVFEVDKRANKTEIRQAVEKLFGVKVDKVHTVRVPRKQKRVGRHVGYTSERKKAIITLSADSKSIEMFGEA